MTGAEKSLPVVSPPGAEDDFAATLRIFTEVPAHNHDVVAFRGQVIVFETGTLGLERIQEGALYVVENQRPMAGMQYANWLQAEIEDPRPRLEPAGRLNVTRQVVRMVRLAGSPGMWFRRLDSGFTDGPLPEWAAPLDIVGKVAGVFRPR